MRSQRNKLFFFVSFLYLLSFNACNNELDILDKYRETTIIYGLLSVSDSVQYIRVEKAFLGEGNALLMAHQADSIYYDTAEIDLSLIKILNGVIKDTLRLYPTNEFPKDDGLFANYPNILYRTQSGKMLNADYTYQLLFHNKSSGHTITAVTPVISQVSLNPFQPSPLADPGIQLNLVAPNPIKIGLVTPLNGKFLTLLMRINYKEVELATSKVNFRTLDFYQNVNVADNTYGNQMFEYLIDGKDFFQYVARHVKKDTGILRASSYFSVDFILIAGAEEFYTYYIVSNSSNGISDNIPEYTNLSEGKGIFSSRSTKIFPNKKLNDISLDSLIYGQYTIGLFQ